MNVIGPIPQMAMTARLGAVGLDAVMVRRASDAADEGAGGADTVSVGIELSPLATHQAPETTTQ